MTDAERQAAQEIRAVMSGQQLRVVEPVDDDMPPAERDSEALMLAAVDTVAIKWVAELQRIRDQTNALEAMVIAQCDRTKADISKLHALGLQTLREAERTQDVNTTIAIELDKMMERQDA